MYKVFFNDSSILLTSKGDSKAEKFVGKEQFRSALQQMEPAEEPVHISFGTDDLRAMWAEFQSLFTLVEAAGGIVENFDQQILMIYRLGKWDLPKGKREEGENIKETAVREVAEECGISRPQILEQLPETYHIYHHKRQTVLKTTYWFYMKTVKDEPLSPQTEEDIEVAKWCAKEEFIKNMEDSYASLQWLVKQTELFK